MVWSRVSNKADMSRAVRIVIFPVNGFHEVICEFEQSSLIRMEFAIGRLQRAEIVQEPCEKRGGDLEQIATEWISTEMHSNHHGVSAGPKSPHLSIVEFFFIIT